MQQGIFIKNCEAMAYRLFEVMDIEVEESTDFDREILSILSFGMISAYGMDEEIEISLVSVAAQYVLMKVFKYSKEKSESILQLLIDNTQKGKNPTYYRIIHEGIEMYYEYVEEEDDKMFDRIMKIYLSFRK